MKIHLVAFGQLDVEGERYDFDVVIEQGVKGAVLDGGITQWINEGRPIETSVPILSPKTFVPHQLSDQWLTVRQVQAGLADASILLLDVRTAERFRGEQKPIDPVAGHVPGAVNRPFSNNLGQDGRFLPSQDLKRRFEQRLGRYRPEQVPQARTVNTEHGA